MITTRFVSRDPALAGLTARHLGELGMRVMLGNEQGDEGSCDCLVLDLDMSPRASLASWRADHPNETCAIVVLGERGNEAACIEALEAGADDYVEKPFSPRELFARIAANVRRARGEAGPRLAVVRVGDLVIDPRTLIVMLGDESIPCTSGEFALLHALGERAGRIVSREELQRIVTGAKNPMSLRSIDVMVSKLRAKLRDDSQDPKILKTVRGNGYFLCARAE